MAKRPDLDVEAGLVVTGEETRVGVGVKTSRAHEHVAQHSLMAAERAGIVVRDDQCMTKIVQAQ